MDNLECTKCKISHRSLDGLGNCPFCKTPNLRVPEIVPDKKFCPVCNKDYQLTASECNCGRVLFILGRVAGWKDETLCNNNLELKQPLSV